MEIDYDRIKYVTNRALENDKGEKTGHILMYSYDEINFEYKMKCPYCGAEQEGVTTFTRRPYRIECKSCGRKILIKRLKPD